MLAFLSLASGFCFCFAFVSYSLLIVFIFEFFCLFSNFCYLGFFFFLSYFFVSIYKQNDFVFMICLWFGLSVCFIFCGLGLLVCPQLYLFVCVCGFFLFFWGFLFCFVFCFLWPHCIACGLFIPWRGLGPGPSMAAPSPGC